MAAFLRAEFQMTLLGHEALNWQVALLVEGSLLALPEFLHKLGQVFPLLCPSQAVPIHRFLSCISCLHSSGLAAVAAKIADVR